jgi:hypothetical protein
MPRPQTYRDVDLPDEWVDWPPDAQVNYLASVMDRDGLLERVGDLADIPDDEIGAQSIHKTGLAQLIVALGVCDHPERCEQ